MQEQPALPPVAGTSRLSAQSTGHRCLLLGTGPQTALLHACPICRLSTPATSISWTLEAFRYDVCFQPDSWLKVHQILLKAFAHIGGKHFPLNVML